MKREFAVMLPGLSPTAEHDDAGNSRAAVLRALAAKHSLSIFTEADLAGPPSGDFCGDVEFPVSKLPRQAIMLIGGCPEAALLKQTCLTLAALDIDFLIVVDALDNAADLQETLVELNEALIDEHSPAGRVNYGPVQLTVSGALPALLKARRLMFSAFSRADSTTTTVVLVEAGGPDCKVLVIERAHEPYRGFLSLPGGFLNVHLEDLPHCAARELQEECGLSADPNELILVDVRSAVSRDARGHVVDHGYLWMVPEDKKAVVLASVAAGDDAKPGSARFVGVKEVLCGELAFDHRQLLVGALSRAGVN